jgi:periplasmic protein TonB
VAVDAEYGDLVKRQHIFIVCSFVLTLLHAFKRLTFAETLPDRFFNQGRCAMQYMLREQSMGKSVSRLGFVVGVHVILGAALIATLNRVPNVNITPPSITLVNPPRPPEPPQPETRREIKTTNLSTARTIIIPPIDIAIENPPVTDVVSVTPTLATPSENRDSLSTTTDGAVVAPTVANLGIACPNAAQVQSNMRYPAQAVREGIEGDVIVRFVVAGAGEIKNVAIVSSSNRIFNNVVTQAVQQFGCRGQGQDVVVEAPFTFRLK